VTDRILGMLGLMRKASALVPGEDSTSETVLAGKARLLLLPADAPEKKRQRAARYTEGRSCLIVSLPCREAELSEAVGTGGCSMAAVTDLGFADALMKALKELDPETYGPSAQEVHDKLMKLRQRKASKPGKGKK